jgi:hypothetical protein
MQLRLRDACKENANTCNVKLFQSGIHGGAGLSDVPDYQIVRIVT